MFHKGGIFSPYGAPDGWLLPGKLNTKSSKLSVKLFKFFLFLRLRMSFEKLFNPKTIALIGASDKHGRIGKQIFDNLVEWSKVAGYLIFPVNPNYSQVNGTKCWKSILDIDSEIDLAVIALAAPKVPGALKECVSKRVKFVIPIASGFKEVGKAGERLESELKEIIRGSQTRMLGPNTLGILIPGRINTTFLDTSRFSIPPSGPIAFISQSGATATTIMDQCSLFGIGLSAFAGLGNRADITENELISYFTVHEESRSIGIYLESFANGREFFELCSGISRKKPIVLLKGGLTKAGSQATLSHTGSLARATGKVIEGLFEQAGVIMAKDEVELIDYSKALAYLGKIPAGSRIAMVTSAGGVGVIATDLLVQEGLKLAKLSKQTREALEGVAPPFASTRNPIDLTGSITVQMLRRVIEILCKAKEVDAILLFAFFQPPGATQEQVEVVETFKEVKPIVCCSIGGEFTLERMRDYQNKIGYWFA
jgi:acyl-CoA synthetase (NDP forming)